MSIWENKKEIIRLLDSPKNTKIWVRMEDEDKWILRKPEGLHWTTGVIYIVDDHHAKIRKQWIDRGKPTVEWYNKKNGEWIQRDSEPTWDVTIDYRLKPMEWHEDPKAVGKPIWVSDNQDTWCGVEILKEYNSENEYPFKTIEENIWKYAKPVTCDELYKGE